MIIIHCRDQLNFLFISIFILIKINFFIIFIEFNFLIILENLLLKKKLYNI